MAQSAASYGEAVLHAPTGALHKDAFSDEAASFHSAMKHSAFASYDERNKKREFPVCKSFFTSYIMISI